MLPASARARVLNSDDGTAGRATGLDGMQMQPEPAGAAPSAEPYRTPTFKGYLRGFWHLLESKAMFYIVVYTIGSSMFAQISTTAGGAVKQNWAQVQQLPPLQCEVPLPRRPRANYRDAHQVQNLQQQLFSIVGSLLFAWGLTLVRKRLLNYSWRTMLAATGLFLNGVDAIFVFCTIYNVVRNQYFYLSWTPPIGMSVMPKILVLLRESFLGQVLVLCFRAASAATS